jgi:ABC-2 type transport system permease protein
MRLLWLSAATLWQRELIRFWREKARVAGYVGSPLVFWLVVGAGFGNLAFFFAGALVLTVMFSAVFSTMSLIEDRREGFLLSVLVSPAPRLAIVLGKAKGSATLAWIQGLIFLAFAPLAGFSLDAGRVAAAAGAIFLLALAFSLLGSWIAWATESSQGFHAIMNLLLFPLWLVSGAVFPPGSAHSWIRALMAANPLTYGLALLRRALESNPPSGTPGLGASLAVALVATAALLVACLVVVRRPSRRGSA